MTMRGVPLVSAVGAILFAGGRFGEPLPPLAQESVDTTLVVRATGSTLFFEPDRLSARNGARVRLRFINDGTLPHNLVIVRDDADIDALAAAALLPSAEGYVPVVMKDRMVAYTALASPGEAVEVVFVMPLPGEYTYICLMSGHANSMLGTLRSLR